MAKIKQDGRDEISIGISFTSRKRMAEELSGVLADTYTLYLNTHNFHWNVTGPQFYSLHTIFMAQYTELWNAVDPIAERIRALGFPAPGSYEAFSQLSHLPSAPLIPPKANKMLEILVKGHELLASRIRNSLVIAEEIHDQPSADLLTQRCDLHEKTAWMLRAQLKN